MPPHASGKGKWIAALVGVAALAGGGGWLLSNADRSPAATAIGIAAPKTGTGSSGIPAPTAAQKLVTLKIAASPGDSEISLDGAKLDGNPFTGQFPKDAALRRLEVRCYGRITEARMIRLDQDLDLLIALPVDRALAPKKGALSPAAAAATAPSASAIAAKPGAKRPADAAPGTASAAAPTLTHRETPSARPIDDSDPYAK